MPCCFPLYFRVAVPCFLFFSPSLFIYRCFLMFLLQIVCCCGLLDILLIFLPACLWRLALFGLFCSSSSLLRSSHFSLPLSFPTRNSDQGSLSRLSSRRPHYGTRLHFLSREDFLQHFLPSSTRISYCGYPHHIHLLGALSAADSFASFFSQINFKARPTSGRRAVEPQSQLF